VEVAAVEDAAVVSEAEEVVLEVARAEAPAVAVVLVEAPVVAWLAAGTTAVTARADEALAAAPWAVVRILAAASQIRM